MPHGIQAVLSPAAALSLGWPAQPQPHESCTSTAPPRTSDLGVRRAEAGRHANGEAPADVDARRLGSGLTGAKPDRLASRRTSSRGTEPLEGRAAPGSEGTAADAASEVGPDDAVPSTWPRSCTPRHTIAEQLLPVRRPSSSQPPRREIPAPAALRRTAGRSRAGKRAIRTVGVVALVSATECVGWLGCKPAAAVLASLEIAPSLQQQGMEQIHSSLAAGTLAPIATAATIRSVIGRLANDSTAAPRARQIKPTDEAILKHRRSTTGLRKAELRTSCRLQRAVLGLIGLGATTTRSPSFATKLVRAVCRDSVAEAGVEDAVRVRNATVAISSTLSGGLCSTKKRVQHHNTLVMDSQNGMVSPYQIAAAPHPGKMPRHTNTPCTNPTAASETSAEHEGRRKTKLL